MRPQQIKLTEATVYLTHVLLFSKCQTTKNDYTIIRHARLGANHSQLPMVFLAKTASTCCTYSMIVPAINHGS